MTVIDDSLPAICICQPKKNFSWGLRQEKQQYKSRNQERDFRVNSFCKKLDCWVLNVLLCYASQSDFTLGQRDTPSENIPRFSFGGIKIVTWHYGKRGRFLIDFIFLTFLISWLSFSYLLHLLVICIINSTTLIHFNRQTGEQGGSEEFSEIMHRTQLNNHNVFVSATLALGWGVEGVNSGFN